MQFEPWRSFYSYDDTPQQIRVLIEAGLQQPLLSKPLSIPVSIRCRNRELSSIPC